MWLKPFQKTHPIFPKKQLIKPFLPGLQKNQRLIIIPILRSVFQFPNGIPKIHEHEKKPAQGFGLFYEGRLIVFYDYETDLSDGWEDEIIHNNPKKIREKALKMGSNIIEYAFTN